MKFEGKVVLVTGSSAGIGAATAVEFAKEGAKVSITGRNAEALEKTAQQCRNAGLKEENVLKTVADLHEQDQCLHLVDNTIKHFGHLDILVNNAGWFVNRTLMDTTIEDVDAMFNIFVRATFTVTQKAIPSIIKQKGAIINVSTTSTFFPHVDVTAYSIAKTAMDQYTKILALGLADKGVRVNSVNPGLTLTKVFRDVIPNEEKAVQVAKETAKTWHPNKRVATSEEIAKSITFLASEDASMITGVLLPINGGVHLSGPQHNTKVEWFKPESKM